MKLRFGTLCWTLTVVFQVGLGAAPCEARLKTGGGVALIGGGTTYNPNIGYDPGRFFGIAGQAVHYGGPYFRSGLDVAALATQSSGMTIQGGVFGDFVFGHVANADIFVGTGVGFGGGPLFFDIGALYVRPELGVQWNLGRSAVGVKLFSQVAVPLGLDNYYATNYAGVSFSMMFGHFPVARARRAPAPAPRRRAPPPPQRRHRRAPRYPRGHY